MATNPWFYGIIASAAGQFWFGGVFLGMGEKLLTEVECAKYLRINRNSLKKFRNQRQDPLPYLKVGRRILYEPDKVVKWAARSAKRELALKA